MLRGTVSLSGGSLPLVCVGLGFVMVGWRLRSCLVLVYVRVISCCCCFLRTSSVFLRMKKVQVFKVPGEINPADVGTKNLPGTEIKNHIPMLHVRVTP